MTGESVLTVTAAGLGATLVLVIVVSVVMVIKLLKDKINMAKLIKSMTADLQNSSGTSAVKRDVNQDYENIEICDQKAAVKTDTDIEVNENPAYSTTKDL